MDFQVMRENCISIHQEMYELFKVADDIGVDLNLTVKSADELKTHISTKSWDGMGRFAKDLYDNTTIWDKLPDRLWIQGVSHRQEWKKEEARKELLDCYFHLGGEKLFK